MALKDLGIHSVVTKQIRFVFADLKTLQSIMNLERPSHHGLKACSKLLKDHLGNLILQFARGCHGNSVEWSGSAADFLPWCSGCDWGSG